MTDTTGMTDPEGLMSQLSSDEQACKAGGAEQFMKVMENPDLASPQDRDAFVNCLEHDNLLKVFLKGFTDQTGPLSEDTSTCVSEAFQNFDLRAMMLSNPEPSRGSRHGPGDGRFPDHALLPERRGVAESRPGAPP